MQQDKLDRFKDGKYLAKLTIERRISKVEFFMKIVIS